MRTKVLPQHLRLVKGLDVDRLSAQFSALVDTWCKIPICAMRFCGDHGQKNVAQLDLADGNDVDSGDGLNSQRTVRAPVLLGVATTRISGPSFGRHEKELTSLPALVVKHMRCN